MEKLIEEVLVQYKSKLTKIELEILKLDLEIIYKDGYIAGLGYKGEIK